MPGHVGTDIIANSMRARGLPEPAQMSDAQIEELIPRDARDGLTEAGLLAKDATADDLRQLLVRMNADFRDKAPLSAAAAAYDHPRRRAVRGLADSRRRGRKDDRRDGSRHAGGRIQLGRADQAGNGGVGHREHLTGRSA